MAGSIFISYRREDGKAEARSIYQWLSRAFGRRQLFMDVDTIEKGRDFRQVLDRTLAKCDVMLAIVGPRWLDARDQSGGLRLQRADDFVQLEIAIALKRNIPVIPVLVYGARMPRADELPGELKGLASRQAAIVTHENFASDMEGLERDIRALATSRTRSALIAAGVAALIIGLSALGYALWPAPQPRVLAPPTDQAASRPARPAGVPVNECDRLAAAPYDREAVAPGIPLATVSTLAVRALAACEQAVRAFPNERRFAYQLARIHDAAGQVDKAKGEYEALAAQDYAAAMTALAWMSRMVAKNHGEENLWLDRAVKAGNAEAMFWLAFNSLSGLGMNAPDLSAAARLYDRAVKGGHTAAMVHLAILQAKGQGGLTPDPAAASRLLFAALEVGEPMAVVHIFTYGLTHFDPVMPAFIRELQMRLKEAGLYNGAADSKLDEPTRRALEALKGRRS